MSAEPPLIAAVVPAFNRLEKTRVFVEAFRKQLYPRKLLVICDDGSGDGTGEYLKQQPDVITVRGDGSLWWSGGTNAAIRKALEHRPDYLLTINDDSTLDPGYLGALVRDAQAHPGSIMASMILQAQKPERIWGIGASYLNFGAALHALDGYGVPVAHARALLSPTIHVDTTPGNGVLYPTEVFSATGFFDEKWTPQYHGDTLLVHRAAKAGFVPRVSLNASVLNDIPQEDPSAGIDLFLSLRSPFYAPAIFKTVDEYEGEEKALDSLARLAATYKEHTFFPESFQYLKTLAAAPPPCAFVFDQHFGNTASGGRFAFLGYRHTRSLSVERRFDQSHFEHDVTGAGLLRLVLRVRDRCVVHVFAITSGPNEHVDLPLKCEQRGYEPFGDEWLSWFTIEVAPSDFAEIPLAVVCRRRGWRGLYLVSDENVATRFSLS